MNYEYKVLEIILYHYLGVEYFFHNPPSNIYLIENPVLTSYLFNHLSNDFLFYNIFKP